MPPDLVGFHASQMKALCRDGLALNMWVSRHSIAREPSCTAAPAIWTCKGVLRARGPEVAAPAPRLVCAGGDNCAVGCFIVQALRIWLGD